ncbi:hypothetical protein LZ32DRAFT_132068 [Colletotrichum eremochloae]|nr:hypothetical protein LZ32DRAFT_132068 [Colletotrichum eremochloae]
MFGAGVGMPESSNYSCLPILPKVVSPHEVPFSISNSTSKLSLLCAASKEDGYSNGCLRALGSRVICSGHSASKRRKPQLAKDRPRRKRTRQEEAWYRSSSNQAFSFLPHPPPTYRLTEVRIQGDRLRVCLPLSALHKNRLVADATRPHSLTAALFVATATSGLCTACLLAFPSPSLVSSPSTDR